MKLPIEYYGVNPDTVITVKEFIEACKQNFDEEQKKAFIEYAKKELS